MRHVLTQGKEDDDFTPPPTTPSVAVADKWADEDKEDNIKDSWEDEDTPKEQEKPAETKQQETTKKEKPAKKTAKPASKTKGKGAASASSAKASVDDDWLDDPVAEKRRKQHMVEESDFQHTQDMFSGLDEQLSINITNPKDEKDFTALAENLAKKMTIHEKSFHYKGFVKTLLKNLTATMKVEDIKDIASSLTVIANEKLKQEKAPKKKKAAKKAQLNAKDDFDDEYDEYEDFM